MKKNFYSAIVLLLPAMFLAILVTPICCSLASGAFAAEPPSAGPFTIKSIKADPSGKEVIIEFAEAFDRQQAINHLTITPPTVNYRPWESSMPNSAALQINGDFKRDTSYGVKFASGFTALSGRAYAETLKEFSVPHKSPKMDFAVPGSVIELNSRQLVHLAVVNVESVIVESQAVSPLAYFAGQTEVASKPEDMRELLNAFPKDHPLSRYAGDVAISRDIYDTKGKPDQEQNFSMPLANRQDNQKGALLFVAIKDEAFGGAGSSKPTFFNITDLAITCLAGGDDALVWVTSISTGLPVAGAEILACTGSGLFFIAGKTDNDGILRIGTGKKNAYRFLVPGPVAGSRTGIQAVEELNYAHRDLKFLCARTDADVAVVGSPDDSNWRLPFTGVRQTSNIFNTPSEIRSVLFTERGVYRPGETVHFKAVLRSYQEGAIKPLIGQRCTISVQNSKQQPIFSGSLTPGEFGSAALDLPLAASSPLGEYRADLNCGTSSVSTTFRVEEFKPPRHFSRLGFETFKRRDDSYVNHPVDLDFLKVKISGGYYAGGPVKNARVRWQLAYGPSSRTMEGYENYTFGYESPTSEPEPLESGETYLDGDGQLALDFPISREVLAGEKALVVSATVLDFDGRAASSTKSWMAQSPYNVGILLHKPDIDAQSEQQLDAVVVDAAGKRIKTGRIEAEILRWGWTYLRKRNLEGNEYWISERVWRRASLSELALNNGKVSFSASFDWGGDYLVKFTYFAPDGKSYSSATKFNVGWYDPDEGGVNNRDRNAVKVSLSSNRISYRPGQTATVRIGTRRKAVAYLTATGRQGIFDYHVSRPTDGLTEIKIPITDAHMPNVYAMVVGTLARGGFPVYTGRVDDGMPSILYGAMDLPVTRKDEVLSIDIAPDIKVLEAEPGQEVSLNLSVAGEAGKTSRVELAVAVVDEAVLALTGYTTPQLKGLARFDLPLGLYLTDLRAFLLPQTPFKTVRNDALTGGSDGLGLPLDTRKKFEPVAYWNPSLVTGPDGKAAVKFTLPDQMSSFRVFVVACDTGCAFGNAERQLRVAKPFYLEPGIPRFFNQGDSFRIEVAAFNQTRESGNVEFSVSETGGLTVAAEKEAFPLAATDWAALGITGKAEAGGDATLLFKGGFAGKNDAVELTVPVKSGHVRGQNTYYGSIKGVAAITPALPADAAAVAADASLRNESSAVLTLSGSPFLRMTAGLRYLLQYPYGCVEQTSSGVMPLAALRAIVKDGSVPGISVEETDQFLAKGIERLLCMQTDAGGFSYWPGDKEISQWGTFYAASALSEAKLAGFEVPKDSLDRLEQYLRNESLPQGNDRAGGSVALYLLARLGYAKPGDFPSFIKRIDSMGREEAILNLLAASYANALPDIKLADLSLKALTGERKADHHYHDFYASYRADALALMLLDRVTPGSPEGAKLAVKLLDSRGSEGHWQSTSNNGWVLAALSGHFKAATGKGPHKVEVLLPGGKKQVVEFSETGSTEIDVAIADFLADPHLTVTADPQREVLYALTVTLPRIDYARNGHDGGFTILKRIENADGSSAIKVGDLVRVTLEFTPPDHESSYIVLDDPLPAGLVAINSAFRSEEKVGGDNDAQVQKSDSEDYWERFWSPDGFYRLIPDHLEIREDRVVAFRNSLWGWGRSPFRFVYYARAVCQGEFVVPSTRIERMYEPDVNGYTPKTMLTIGGRKQ